MTRKRGFPIAGFEFSPPLFSSGILIDVYRRESFARFGNRNSLPLLFDGNWRKRNEMTRNCKTCGWAEEYTAILIRAQTISPINRLQTGYEELTVNR